MAVVKMCRCGRIPAFEKDGRRYCTRCFPQGATPLEADEFEEEDGAFYRPTKDQIQAFADNIKASFDAYVYDEDDDFYDCVERALKSVDLWNQLRAVLEDYWCDTEWVQDRLGWMFTGDCVPPEIIVGVNHDGTADVIYTGAPDYWGGASPSDYVVTIYDLIPFPPEYWWLQRELEHEADMTIDEMETLLNKEVVEKKHRFDIGETSYTPIVITPECFVDGDAIGVVTVDTLKKYLRKE